jgi:DNA-binding FadR family transcriptional regulator
VPETSLSASNKAGQRLAHRIEGDILDEGLRPGARLGSESDLMTRYDTSRTLLREAVRILEHDGICEMRRGPGGGMYVRDMDDDAVSHAAALWLQFNGAPVEDLYDVRHVLETRCAAWAAERIDERGVALLSECRRREDEAIAAGDIAALNSAVNDFHVAIAEASGNAVASLFVKVLSELNRSYSGAASYSGDEITATRRAHQALAEAIVSGDPVLAAHRATVHMRASCEFSQSQRSTRQRSTRQGIRA